MSEARAAQATGLHEVLGSKHEGPHSRLGHGLLRIQGLGDKEAATTRQVLSATSWNPENKNPRLDPCCWLLPQTSGPLKHRRVGSRSPSPEHHKVTARMGCHAVSDIVVEFHPWHQGFQNLGPQQVLIPQGPLP